MADETALVTGLISDSAGEQEAAVLRDMRALGAQTLAVAEAAVAADAGHAVALGSGLAEDDRLVLYLPFLQMLAFNRSIAKGLDPDAPRNLSAAIILP